MQNAPVLCQNKSSLTDLSNDLFVYVPVEVIPAIPPKNLSCTSALVGSKDVSANWMKPLKRKQELNADWMKS